MKRIVPMILVAAVALIAVGLVVKDRDPATAHTANRDAWLAYEKGESLLQSFRYAAADTMLRRAVALDPGLAVAHAALAELMIRMAQREEAKQAYAAADSLVELIADPNERLLLQVRLSNSGFSKYRDHSDSLLTVAKQRQPNALIVMLTEALRADGSEDVEEAERQFKRILEVNPNYAAAYNFLGYLYLNQGKYDKAETAMRRYAFVAPDLANPHDSLGEVLMTVGRYEEAETEFHTALMKQPDFFHSQRNLGWIYLGRGEVDRALVLLDLVQKEIAGTGYAENLEFQVVERLFSHRLHDHLDVYVARYLASYGEAGGRPYVEMMHALANGRPELAMTISDSLQTVMAKKFESMEEPVKGHYQARFARFQALAAEQARAHDEAARLFRQTLEQTADYPPHFRLFDQIHLAYNLIPLRAYDEARVLVGQALSVNPRISEGILVAANIEAAAGQTTEALRLLDTLDRILERADPDFPVRRDARALREQLPDPDRI
jgi:tetratricopeptide (TPR) repeat protein